VNPRTVSPEGEALVKQFEGCKLAAYPDPGTGGKPWTIGWGSTGPDIAKGMVWTQAQCDARFDRDIQHFAAHVAEIIGSAPTTQHQFDALVSFQYNTGHLPGSTLLALHKAGRFAEAAKQFGEWVHAGGKVLPGLIARRAAESALYLKA